MEKVKGKIVYITGGTKGIGYAVAQTLLSVGMRVAISGRDLEVAKKAALTMGNEDNIFAQGTGYNASKFGLVGFTQAAMLDLRPYGIKVSTIMPGSVSTYFNDHTPTDKDAWKIQPQDIGKLVLDLLTMHPRTLPSKIEVRPTRPDLK